MLGLIQTLTYICAIAWRNFWRYPVRSVLTVLALSGGLTIVIFYAALINGMGNQMVTQATEVSTGYIQVHNSKYAKDHDLYALIPNNSLNYLEEKITDVSFSPRLYAFGLASSGSYSSGVQLRAIDPEMESRVTVQGTKNQQGTVDNPLLNSNSPRAVVVGNKLAKQLRLELASELILVTQAADGSIGNDLFVVEGIAKPVDPGFDRMGVLMRIEDFRELMVLPEGVHEIAVNIHEKPLDEVKSVIRKALNNGPSSSPGGVATEVRTWREINPALSDMLELQKGVVGYAGLIVMLMASFGVMNTIFMSVFERKYEFGVLRAVGMKSRHIFLMVIIETGILTLVASLIGNTCGYLLSLYYSEEGIDFSSLMPDGYDWAGMSIEPVMRAEFQWSAVQTSNLIMLVFVIIATLYPLFRVAGKKPIELLS